MTCARGSTSHSTRKTSSSASWAPRTVSWSRRSARSQARYSALGAKLWSMCGAPSTFDMDLELLPQRVEIAVELGRAACRERREAGAVRGREADRSVRLHLAGAARQH